MKGATHDGCSNMPKVPRLFDRDGNWTYRVRVPDHLQPVIGKKAIWKSLGRIPYADAARQARALAVEHDRLFADAERKFLGDPPTVAEMRQAVRLRFIRDEKASLAAERVLPLGASLVERLDALDEDIAAVAQSFDDPNLQRVATAIAKRRQVLRSARLPRFSRPRRACATCRNRTP